MASEWQAVRIKEIAEKIAMGPFGSNIKVETFVDEGIPVISGAHLRGARVDDGDFNFLALEHAERLRNSNVYRGDVVFTHAGNIGQVAYVPSHSRYERYVISQRQFYLRCDQKKADPAFITYFFHSPEGRHKLLANASQVGVPSISRPSSNLKEIEVLLPSLQEQQAIAGFLGSIDDRIDNLRQTNATLEAIAQALFKSWFVDFDPVRAKAEGREPEGMDPATTALFPSEFEDSELGPIPKGWHVDHIGQVVRCVGGATPSTKNDDFWVDGIHHWATPKDLSGLQAPILITTERMITDAGVARISSGLLPGGTLLMSSRAPIGYLALSAMPVAINQGFIAMPPGGLLPPCYLLFWACENMDSIKQKANGSTFMEISKSAFRPINVCVPTPDVVEAYSAIVDPVLRRIELNEQHKAALAETRDTLLPRLISGKLRLPEVEALADEVA